MEKALVPLGEGRQAICHPDRRHVAIGMCASCYRESLRAPRTALEVQRHNELMALHEQVQYAESLGRQARAVLQDHLPQYAELHFEAAAIAAEQGDARPAQWALEQVKAGKAAVVDPPRKEAGDSGVQVFVGIRMGGMPPSVDVVGG